MPTRDAEPRGTARASPAGPAGERRRIVASKLSAPPLRPGIVDRPALVDALSSANHSAVVLVSAPAGYGKTTLLALWREREQRPFAWVSLDAADNDPVALVAAVLAALDPIVGIDAGVRDSLDAPEPPLEELVLPSLVDACAANGQPFVLVLDDLHAVTDARCHMTIGYLAEWLPAGCQLALATRTDPPLPLASLRAHGRLAELRAAELSLGEGEAAALLAAAGVRLPDEQVARLVERTEGWPAALYLAALSLRERSQPEDFVDRFAGTSRHVADFLSEDVLGRQPEHVIDFLLRTCVLDELTPALCDALTDGAGASAMLRELERSNLFVEPLDDERRTYRYHHLFAEYLRAELTRRDPLLARAQHRRGWQWYREHGLPGRAIAHAQAAGDVAVAADLVAARWLPMVELGLVDTLRGWMRGFRDGWIRRHAPLVIAAAWVSALTGEGARAVSFAKVARRASWEGPMPDGTASLESALAIMSGAFALDGVTRMHADARRALELEPVTSRWRAGGLSLLGMARALEGDFAGAREPLEEVVRLTGGQTSTAATSLAYMALVGLLEGNEDEAFRDAQRAYAIVETPGMRTYMPSILTYAVAANLLSRRGELERAALAVGQANSLLPRLTEIFWQHMVVVRLSLAPALAALGWTSEATKRLAEADVVLAAHDDAGMLPEWYRETNRKLRRGGRRPQARQALTRAERRILRLLATDLSLRDIGRELYLSTNTVKTHTRSIYRKLGVSSRAEAVEAGRSEEHAAAESPG